MQLNLIADDRSIAIEKTYAILTRSRKVSMKDVKRNINARVRMTCIGSRSNLGVNKIERNINCRIKMTSINSRAMVDNRGLERKLMQE